MLVDPYGTDPHTIATIVDARAGLVRYEPRRTKVAIIGAGSGRGEAPWSDPSWVCWGLNEIAQRRATAWFELHPARVQNAADMRALRMLQVPCYVLDLEEWESGAISHPVRYPIQRVLAAGLRDYFACTFAYQIALAITDGFEEIGLWGVELFRGSPRERLIERACVEYWLGVAEGRGLRVTEDSRLAHQTARYGYDYDAEVRFAQREVDGFLAVARLF